MCFDVTDPRLFCAPGDAHEVRLLRPGARPRNSVDEQNRDALEQALVGLGGSVQGICAGASSGQFCDANDDCGSGWCRRTVVLPRALTAHRCTELAHVTVPLRHGGGSRGIERLRL